jgi:hypothetical protein
MSYPLWSGFNAEALNSTEINGAAPSPDLLFDGFDGDVFPVLLGGVAGLYADVMRARAEFSDYALQSEDMNMEVSPARTDLSALPEIRAINGGRSRKDYP